MAELCPRVDGCMSNMHRYIARLSQRRGILAVSVSQACCCIAAELAEAFAGVHTVWQPWWDRQRMWREAAAGPCAWSLSATCSSLPYHHRHVAVLRPPPPHSISDVKAPCCALSSRSPSDEQEEGQDAMVTAAHAAASQRGVHLHPLTSPVAVCAQARLQQPSHGLSLPVRCGLPHRVCLLPPSARRVLLRRRRRIVSVCPPRPQCCLSSRPCTASSSTAPSSPSSQNSRTMTLTPRCRVRAQRAACSHHGPAALLLTQRLRDSPGLSQLFQPWRMTLSCCEMRAVTSSSSQCGRMQRQQSPRCLCLLTAHGKRSQQSQRPQVRLHLSQSPPVLQWSLRSPGRARHCGPGLRRLRARPQAPAAPAAAARPAADRVSLTGSRCRCQPQPLRPRVRCRCPPPPLLHPLCSSRLLRLLAHSSPPSSLTPVLIRRRHSAPQSALWSALDAPRCCSPATRVRLRARSNAGRPTARWRRTSCTT